MGCMCGLCDARVATPQRAAEPEIATQVLVIGMREGKFTPGHTLDRYINDRQTDYNGALAIINSRDTATADPIANLARHWEAEVPALVRRIQRDGITPLPAQAAQAPAMLLAKIEIGRASCRESVWQSRKISVVAVSLKKKMNTYKSRYEISL